MLLPRFKKARLAIAEDSIVLREQGGASHVLSTTQLNHRDHQVIVDALNAHATLLKGCAVDLVLTNVFVRFLVLPWQPGINSRQDWEALANHAFREQYGAVADSWKVKVNLDGYEQAVVAVAIDQALYETLMQLAQQLDFSWQSIQPLAMHLLNKQQQDYVATLIVEPNYLMLCEKQSGQFKQFSVMSPPTAQEPAFVTQEVARLAMQMSGGLASSQVIVYVSGKMKQSWEQVLQNTEQKLPAKTVMPKQQYSHHAGWIAAI